MKLSRTHSHSNLRSLILRYDRKQDIDLDDEYRNINNCYYQLIPKSYHKHYNTPNLLLSVFLSISISMHGQSSFIFVARLKSSCATISGCLASQLQNVNPPLVCQISSMHVVRVLHETDLIECLFVGSWRPMRIRYSASRTTYTRPPRPSLICLVPASAKKSLAFASKHCQTVWL